jgi:hypothetical protein
VLALVALIALAVLTAQAYGHVERASYWPDPAPDNSLRPAAGGKVPEARSLFTALKKRPPGVTRVVCQGKVPSRKRIRKLTRSFRSARRSGASRRVRAIRRSLKSARRSYKRKVRRNPSMIRLAQETKKARQSGYRYRPSEPLRSFSAREARRLRKFNERLLARCRFNSIQSAVNPSRNNDRIVVMPGVYTEPRSRRQPTNDPRCAKLKILNDRSNPVGALSYEYHLRCPNDANLIAIAGRELGKGKDPQPPREDRHGIPNIGPCKRCNLQLEGSGVTADDTIVDAGRVASGNGGPAEPKKDVGIFVDRADGFVLRNMTVRHVHEHGIYALEVDGLLLERFKTFFTEEYGVLTFVGDHHLMQDCEAKGAGDAGLYPGSSADVGAETREAKPRFSTEIRRCDMHHNAAGYSGTAANAVHVHHNDFYDNALGFTTDVFTAAGHPGFPQDSDLVENNEFYDNNFNPFAPNSDVVPTIPVPVGTGAWIAGGNNNTFRNNRFWNNWKRGIMLFTVPDAFVCGDNELAGGNHQAGCKEDGTISTSFDNKFHGNIMGRDPAGKQDPNGVDFWWDQFPNQQYHRPPTTTGNCWFDNKGRDGTPASIKSEPPGPALPSNCNASLGTSNPDNEAELLNCFAKFDEDTPDAGPCDWFTTPSEPE